MEIYIAINGSKSETIKSRLDFEEITDFYNIKADRLIDLLKDKGYEVHRNGLFKIVKPNDEKIAIYTDENQGLEMFSILFHMPFDLVSKQFNVIEGTITKFWLQNYAEGYSAPRLIYLNDNTHNYKEV